MDNMYIDNIDIVTLNLPYKNGKKQKKHEVENHFNSNGMTLKKLIPLIVSYNDSVGHYDHKVKLTIEFEEVE